MHLKIMQWIFPDDRNVSSFRHTAQVLCGFFSVLDSLPETSQQQALAYFHQPRQTSPIFRRLKIFVSCARIFRSG